VTLKIKKERKNAIKSGKRVIASLVLLFGFLPVTSQTQGMDKKGLAVEGWNRGTASAAVNSRRLNAANSFGAGAPPASNSSEVIYIDSNKVAATFAKGGVLYDGDGGKKNFQVHASHREGTATEAAVHTLDTDIVYVLQGSATLVTGGTVVNAKTVPNGISGTAIDGGAARHLSKGDVIIIPNGVPHWYKETRGPFLYYVVKVH
jgi:mannose-6-phosphate isomerase-like protein (cupin superfamily)